MSRSSTWLLHTWQSLELEEVAQLSLVSFLPVSPHHRAKEGPGDLVGIDLAVLKL